ncbi:MAG: deoxyribonuclease IV [Deltaproteobacteria bacterium]|nr:deoxyribonuclease IV [Deltaproteobacteria bacterium]
MRLGLHLSTAGGPAWAVAEARKLGLDCLQIFAGSPRMWRRTPVSPAQAAAFRLGVEAAGLEPVVVHAPYLINLASPDGELWQKSVDSLAYQLTQARELGADAVVVHPGSTRGRPAAWGVARAAAGVDLALDLAGVPAGAEALPQIWLENTAGGKNHLGGGLFQMHLLLAALAGRPVGVVLDTAHAWGAGYRLDGPRAVGRFLDRVDRLLGPGSVKLWHCNDTSSPRGSHRDVHQHLGRGLIGDPGFQALAAEPRLAGAALVMETPKDSRWADRRNLAYLRRLLRLAAAGR